MIMLVSILVIVLTFPQVILCQIPGPERMGDIFFQMAGGGTATTDSKCIVMALCRDKDNMGHYYIASYQSAKAAYEADFKVEFSGNIRYITDELLMEIGLNMPTSDGSVTVTQQYKNSVDYDDLTEGTMIAEMRWDDEQGSLLSLSCYKWNKGGSPIGVEGPFSNALTCSATMLCVDALIGGNGRMTFKIENDFEAMTGLYYSNVKDTGEEFPVQSPQMLTLSDYSLIQAETDENGRYKPVTLADASGHMCELNIWTSQTGDKSYTLLSALQAAFNVYASSGDTRPISDEMSKALESTGCLIIQTVKIPSSITVHATREDVGGGSDYATYNITCSDTLYYKNKMAPVVRKCCGCECNKEEKCWSKYAVPCAVRDWVGGDDQEDLTGLGMQLTSSAGTVQLPANKVVNGAGDLSTLASGIMQIYCYQTRDNCKTWIQEKKSRKCDESESITG